MKRRHFLAGPLTGSVMALIPGVVRATPDSTRAAVSNSESIRRQSKAVIVAEMARIAPLVSEVLGEAYLQAAPGVPTSAIGQAIEHGLDEHSLAPAYQGAGYPAAASVSVHPAFMDALPDSTLVASDSLVTFQTAASTRLAYALQSWTFSIGTPPEPARRAIVTSRDALTQAVAVAVAGGGLGDIETALAESTIAGGCVPVFDFVGYAVGQEMRELPQVFMRPVVVRPSGPLPDGTVLNIMAMVTSEETRLPMRGQWAVTVADGAYAAVASALVAFESGRGRLLTRFLIESGG